jgi:O-antigen ligase/polysaccharide polymerase Wzy-like membrane protein
MRPGVSSDSPRAQMRQVPGDNFGSLVTTILLALILAAAPSVLGSARLWYELPLLGVIAFLLALQAIRLLAPPASARRIDFVDLAVVLFVVYAAARWLTSPTGYFSRLEILSIVGYATLFFTCRYGLVRRSHALALVVLLGVVGLGEAIFGYCLSLHSDVNHPESLWFPFGSDEQLQIYYAPRWIGTYGCPDHYASLLVMAAGATLALACFSKWPWPLRITLFYVAAVLMGGLLFSGSRGGWISLVGSVTALTFFGLRYGAVRWWVPVAGAVIFLAALGAVLTQSSFAQDRLSEVRDMLSSGRVSGYVRIELDRDALRIARDQPFFGTGPATFIFIHPRYQDSTFGFKAMLTHDDYLNCLDDYGLVGFGLAMIFVFSVTLSFLNRVRADFRWADRTIVAAGFAAWCALLVHSAVDFNMHIPANAMILLSLVGLGLRRLPGEEVPRHWSTVSLAPAGRRLGAALLVFALAYGIETARTAVSDIIYEGVFAKAENVPTDQSVAGLETALSCDPGNANALLLLGDVYRVQAINEKAFPDRIATAQQALAAYQRALKANPLDDTIQGRMGLTFDLMRRYQEAFFCYKAAVTARPYDGQFWSALGNHFWQRGLVRKAAEAYMIAAGCPHGNEGAAESAQEVSAIIEQEGFAPPAPGTNPLLPEPAPPEAPTVP